MTLSALLSKRAKEIPKKICLKFGKKKFTYSDLDRLVSITSGGLKTSGLKHQDRVAVLMDNCPEYIISYFAVLRAGGVVVPLNTFLTPDEISYILNDSACKVLIYSAGFLPHVEKIRNAVPGLKAFMFDEIPVIPKASPLEKVEADLDENEVAVFLYTSGTTGFPKGAMLSHRNLIANAEASMKAMEVSGSDRILLFLPLFHSFSFTVCVILPIFAGAQIILLASVKPFSKVIKSIFTDRITLFVAIPTIYNILSRKKMPFFLRFFFKFLVNIRACISGAAALPADTINAFEKRFNIPLIEGYGLTEASPVVAVNPLRGVRKPSSVGLPVPGVEVAVAGEDGKNLPDGETGELIVRGANVMQGYYNREKETEEVLKDGWLYTGDMAKIDSDGYIYIVDRKKDLIIIDGMNMYPREVEDLVIQHPSIEECAMVGIPDGRGSEIPVLFIKTKDHSVINESDIRGSLRGRFAQYKMPKRTIFIEAFPKTATGKIKKTELRKWKI
ncbi:MAG: long-chain fatty acid--CoA ligase [Nitrospirae bacterium]|nr:long-chain fatty acid--CoA ligase [Nitrospirota bacterium]